MPNRLDVGTVDKTGTYITLNYANRRIKAVSRCKVGYVTGKDNDPPTFMDFRYYNAGDTIYTAPDSNYYIVAYACAP